METTIISLGGSIIAPCGIDSAYIRDLKGFISGLNGRCAIVVGGGKLARDYQAAGKEIGGFSSLDLDWIGIYATRLNAELVRLAFGEEAHGEVIIDPSKPFQTKSKIIIGAGWKPGWSTDYCAITLAENLRSTLVINLSNISCVYDKDPKKYPDAKEIRRCGWKEMRKIVGNSWEPGLNVPFDPIAAKKAEKLGIRVAIMDGRDLPNLGKFILGKDFEGTLIG